MSKKWFGSLINRLDEGHTFTDKIEVGTGVTEMCYSDRHAYEVVKVIDDKHLLIRRCDAKRIDNYGESDVQDYEYTLNPYKETILTQELLDDEFRMNHIKHFNPKLYKKIMESKVGDVIGDNNHLLVKTKYGWKERYSNGKYNINKFTVGIKEEYWDPSF